MLTPLRKLATLDLRAVRDLMKAQAALLRAQRRLRRDPVGSFVTRERARREPVAGSATRAAELAVAVERVATHGLFRPYCLVRAIALRELLVAHGIGGSSIRIGVRRVQGEFRAHAWIRWGDTVLGDRAEHVAAYSEVEDIRVLTG